MIDELTKALSTRIRIFSNPQLFCCGYGYRPHVYGEFDSESDKKLNTLSKVEKNISATNPLTCGRVNPDIFLSDDVKSVSSLSPNNREFYQTTTATVTIATPNKRFNEQNNDCARAF